MIEKTLDKILEQLVLLNLKVTASGATAPEPKPPTTPAPPAASKVEQTNPETEKTGSPQISRDEIGKALKSVGVISMEAAVQMLAKYGAKTLADVKPENYITLAGDVVAFHAKLAAPATPESLGL